MARVRGDRLRGFSILREQKQYLRKNETFSERILWLGLKGKQIQGLKFRRQHGIGPFIVDFYCDQYKLIIELDGSVHDEVEVKRYDQERQKYLEEAGYTVLRIQNEEVLEHFETVKDRIIKSLPIPRSVPHTSPPFMGESEGE